MSAPGELPPALEADFAALRKLRDDDASGALKEYFGDGTDPREWTYESYGSREIVTLTDGRVTKLKLHECTKLSTLPVAIGELGALRELVLDGCSSLVALPESIGELGALKDLNLYGCSKLERLPDAIVGREGLTVKLPVQLVKGPLGEDFAALRKLRDDASGALKEYFGDGEDPREWKYDAPWGQEKCVIVNDGRVTKLSMRYCSDLAALPAAIGELGALTTL